MEPAKQNLILKTQPTDNWKRVNERKEKNWLVVWKSSSFDFQAKKYTAMKHFEFQEQFIIGTLLIKTEPIWETGF